MGFLIHQSFIVSVTILCLFTIPSSSLPSKTAPIATKPSVYEVLKGYDFPIGLLPKGVLDYDLDPSTGKFSAFLNGSCEFSLEGSYQLNYKSTIKGHISKGKLSGLEGVSVKLLFVWVDIVEVLRSDDALEFSVGIAGADFPISNFEEIPQCGCGLNCNGGQLRKVQTHPNLYSAF